MEESDSKCLPIINTEGLMNHNLKKLYVAHTIMINLKWVINYYEMFVFIPKCINNGMKYCYQCLT